MKGCHSLIYQPFYQPDTVKPYAYQADVKYFTGLIKYALKTYRRDSLIYIYAPEGCQHTRDLLVESTHTNTHKRTNKRTQRAGPTKYGAG